MNDIKILGCRNDSKYLNSDLKTLKQWNKEHKSVIDGMEGIPLYHNGHRQAWGYYYWPEQVRDMTKEEWNDYRLPFREKAEKLRRKKASQVIKERIEAREEGYKEGFYARGWKLGKELIAIANQMPIPIIDNPSGVIVIDTETTGLSPEKDEIIQISIIDGDERVLMNEYVQPYHMTEWPDAERVNGISPEMCKEQPFAHELIPQFKGIFESAQIIVGYNHGFDLSFLERWGISCEGKKQIDVMQRFAPIYGQWSEKYGEYKWQKLITCAAYYGYDFKAHDSLEDVKATWYCCKKICKPEEYNIARVERRSIRAEMDTIKKEIVSDTRTDELLKFAEPTMRV